MRRDLLSRLPCSLRRLVPNCLTDALSFRFFLLHEPSLGMAASAREFHSDRGHHYASWSNSPLFFPTLVADRRAGRLLFCFPIFRQLSGRSPDQPTAPALRFREGY